MSIVFDFFGHETPFASLPEATQQIFINRALRTYKSGDCSAKVAALADTWAHEHDGQPPTADQRADWLAIELERIYSLAIAGELPTRGSREQGISQEAAEQKAAERVLRTVFVKNGRDFPDCSPNASAAEKRETTRKIRKLIADYFAGGGRDSRGRSLRDLTKTMFREEFDAVVVEFGPLQKHANAAGEGLDGLTV